MDDIPSKLIRSGVDGTVKALTALWQKIWEQMKWSMKWNTSLAIPYNSREASDNVRTAGPQAWPATQARCCKLRSRTEYSWTYIQLQCHNCELLDHQCHLYYNFIDFKKAFGRICHDGHWKVLIGGTIDGGFVQVIRALCDHLSSELFWTVK